MPSNIAKAKTSRFVNEKLTTVPLSEEILDAMA
jgi:hypothetical protein